jgi:hypothetical protein
MPPLARRFVISGQNHSADPKLSTPIPQRFVSIARDQNTDLYSGFLADVAKHQTTVKFANAATDGTQEELYLRGDSFKNQQNTVICRGICCGIIDERFKYSKRQYVLSVAPGLDPFPVALLAVNLDEKENEDQSSKAGRIANYQGIAGSPYSGFS